jgi:hypothetical protein
MAKPPDDLDLNNMPGTRARDADSDAERAKREEFLALVTCGIQAMLQETYSRPGLDPQRKARVLSRRIHDLSIAYSAADKIPSDASALGAALDVLDHVFSGIHSSEADPDASWLDEIDEGEPREHRAEWAGFEPHSVWLGYIAQARFDADMRRVDREMQPGRAEWQGLPFNDSVALEALSWVRSEEKIFERQLHQQIQKVDGDVLRSHLKTLEKDGWIKSDKEPDGAITYQSTFKLRETGPPKTRKARLPKPTFATPTEHYHARTRAARVDRMAELHRSPDARKILKAIKRLGPMQLKEIGPLVPQMKRLALRAFMMQLREGGWVEGVGRGGGAAWAGTDQLKNSKI